MLLANCQVETLKASESQYARVVPGRFGLAVPFIYLCQCQCPEAYPRNSGHPSFEDG